MKYNLLFAWTILLIIIFGTASQAETEESSFLSSFFHDHGIVILIIDPNTGEIEEANSAASEFYGYTSEELKGMQIQEINILTPGEINQEMELAVRQERNFFKFQHRIADGSIRHVEVYSYPISWEGKTKLFSTIQDVTPRIEAEQALYNRNVIFYVVLSLALIVQIIIIISLVNTMKEKNKALNIIKSREQELRIIANNMAYVVAMADVEGRFTYLSESSYHLNGYRPSELLGKSIFELIHEEDLSALGFIYQEGFVEGRKDARFECRGRHKNGGYVWVETISSLMLDDNGQPSGALFVSRDISDRKHAEEQIERLAQIADNAPSSILVHDYEGNIFYANEHTFYLYGYIKEDFMKLNLRDISAPESAELITARMKDIKEKGEAEFEVRNVRKDSSTFPLQVYVKQTEWFGKPALLSVSIDITERKMAEAIIIESEQRLIQAQHIAKLGDFTWDVNSGEVNWSDGVLKLLGYDKSETINYAKVNAEIHHPDDLERVTKWLNECIESGSGILTLYEYRLIRKDKKEIHVQTTGVIERDKDNQIKVFATLQDITERKKTEEKIIHIGFHDQLTDLYNRHYFKSCEEELKEIPLLSVIMTDVNGLKLINDTYGHKVGDELLKNYAALLRKSFKQSDLIFRWGGDEFIVILRNTEEAKSWELCNRLIKHCGKTFIKDIPLSISVGISSKLEGGSIDKAIQEAEDMMYKNKLTESKSNKNLIMKTLLQTLSEKSFETKEHIERMTLIGRQFGERLSLPHSELSRLETFAMLHDIGKINIDSRILLKKTTITDEEWVEIKKHPEVGYRITRATEEFAYIAEEILAHHERWDGKGYPQGLQGEDIPYLARILNLIDSYDVMSSGRPYKKKMLTEEIIEEIEKCSGKQFDPDLAKEFITCLKEGTITYQE